ncbi:cell filamentation protein [Gammaproteobacteria bacterium]
MTFDPFADFETRGYLRNLFGERDLEIVRHLEHSAFVSGVEEAIYNLSWRPVLSYKDVLDTHRILFKDIYPWAGQDRLQTAPDIAVSKGSVLFAHPEDVRQAVEYALRLGQDKYFMSQKYGEVMGHLAYGHPFLDGNGRTIMVVHSELAQRAGISIDWAATDKTEYLAALTREIDQPSKGILDAYLKPFLRSAVGSGRLASHIAKTKGLDGTGRGTDENKILGSVTDPSLQARYKEQKRQRTAYK